MKKYAWHLIILIFVLAAFWPSPAYAKALWEDRVVFGGTYTLESGETLNGNLMIFGGAATTEEDSTVKGDVVLIGGVAEINGEITGSFVGIGGAVQLTENALVNGDLVTIGAVLNRDEGAQVNGNIVSGVGVPFVGEVPYVIESDSQIEVPDKPDLPMAPALPGSSGVYWNFNPLLNMMWFFFRTFMLALLAILVVIFFEKPTSRVSNAAFDQPILAGGVGLITTFLTPIALVALTVTIILIPVTLLTALAFVVAVFFGWIALGLEVGRRIAGLFKVEWAPAVSAGIGTFLLSLVIGGLGQMIPCLGIIPLFLAGIWGLGSVILTRFGTQDYVPAGSTSVSSVEAELPAAGEPPSVEAGLEPELLPDPDPEPEE